MEAFLYLGQMIAYNNIDWAEVYQNLWKDQRPWGMVAQVLENKRETVRAQRVIYKAEAQSNILYVSKIWVVTGDILKVLEGFHHQAA